MGVVNLLGKISEIASVAALLRNDHKKIMVIARETMHPYRSGERGNLNKNLLKSI